MFRASLFIISLGLAAAGVSIASTKSVTAAVKGIVGNIDVIYAYMLLHTFGKQDVT